MISAPISEIISHASFISVAFPFIFYLLRLKYATRPAHLIGAMTLISGLSDSIGLYRYKNGLSNVALFNAYDVAFFLLLAWFYYEVSNDSPKHKSIVRVSLVIYIIAYLVVVTLVQSFFSEYLTLMWTLGGTICILYSISYFISVFSAIRPMNNAGLLWINSGVLFYFSFNLFLFVMANYVLTKLDHELGLIIWSFHNVNNILKNLLIGLGLSAFRDGNSQSGALA